MKYDDARKSFLTKISERFDILSPYNGNQTYRTKIEVRNRTCLHTFFVDPRNLVRHNINCIVCNNQKKRAKMQAFNQQRHQEFQKTAEPWKAYKHKVYMLTRASYRAHKNTINPSNLPLGRAGVEGAYHLDHIKSVRFCFENYISTEQCADTCNLQMLPWRENIIKR